MISRSQQVPKTMPVPAEPSRRGARLRRWAWHPILIAGAFVIGNVAETGVHPAAAGRALLVALLSAVALQTLFSFAFRDARIGALAATLLVAGVAFWIPLAAFGIATTRSPVILPALAAILAALVVLTKRRWSYARAMESITYGLNVLSTAFMAVVVGGAVTSPLAAQLPNDLGLGSPDRSTAGAARSDRVPDMYLFLMDGHPSRDSLLEQTGHDISSFTRSLEEFGFAISAGAHANYNWTGASLTSLLHMGLVDEPTLDLLASGDGAPHELVDRVVINRNPAFDVLWDHGYEIVAVGPPYEHAALRSADRFIDAGYFNSFECHLIRRTGVGAGVWAIAPGLTGDVRRAGVVKSIQSAVTVASTHHDAPQFVIVHLPVPHLPVLWDEAGEPVDDPLGSDCAPPGAAGLQPEQRNAAYLGTVDHTDRLVLEGVEEIVAASEPAPVILLLSDHGAHLGGSVPDRSDPRAWRDEFGILFAALTPGEPDLFPEGESLANVLPRVFNAYLETDLQLSPDKSFWPDGSPAPEP